MSGSAARVVLDPVPLEARSLLEAASALAERRGERLAWVGGGVRDLLLGRSGLDLDLVLEGDLLGFAHQLADRLDGRLRFHPRFLTATLALPGTARLDLVRARRERYDAPAALPEVEPATLAEDLARRDFTINSLALVLAPGQERGELIDPLGGERDLAARLLRALHPRSFVDDPTRLLRGLRFALRFGFGFETGTGRWARAAAVSGVVDAVSGARLAHDLRLLFDDRPEIEEAIAALGDLGLAAAIAPTLDRQGPLQRAMDLAAGARRAADRGSPHLPARGWRLALLAVATAIGDPAAAALASRLALPGSEQELAISGPRRVAHAVRLLARAAQPHEAAKIMARLSDDELALLGASDPICAAWVQRWLLELRDLRLDVTGADLITAGVRPGSRLGAALLATRRARLDGLIGPDQELEFALRQARRGGDPQ